MKIRKISCEQFAGIQNREAAFTDGLNLVIGQNESGKSTLAELMYQTLFQHVKLDGRSDAAFLDRYFPKKDEGPQGNVVDGTIVFETPTGIYRLRKEWERGAGECRLTLPDGTQVKGERIVTEILDRELKYRAGVYREIVFPSQRRDQIAVESIMRVLSGKTDPLTQTREDLAGAVTRTALEAGGVSLDKIEKRLRERISELSSHWDIEADLPEGGIKRGIRNEWKREVGKILEAYYAQERIRAAQESALRAEEAAEREHAALRTLRAGKKEAEEEREGFLKFSGLLGQRSLLTKAFEEGEQRLRRETADLTKWPRVREELETARELRRRLADARIHARYEKAAAARAAWKEAAARLARCREVESADLADARDCLARKQRAEGMLAGMNLSARIRRLGETPVYVRSLVTGEHLEAPNGEMKITEAVDLSVPGVMELRLTPLGVDSEALHRELKTAVDALARILDKYGVSEIARLQDLFEERAALAQEEARCALFYESALGEETWEQLCEAQKNTEDVICSEEEITQQIKKRYGDRPMDEQIGGLERTLADLKSRYGAPDALEEEIKKLREEQERTRERLASFAQIPAAFREISDPEQYDRELLDRIARLDRQILEQEERLRASERGLGETSAEEYAEVLLEKQAALEARKAEYRDWIRIEQVFRQMKEEAGGNPAADIEARFREYLGLVSGGGLNVTALDERMNARLSSGPYALTYEILSEGTKDTVALAFRLAMLEHLYPEGDGLAIFDDPFTDMDPVRRGRACELIRRFARRNQVIFITCDDAYKTLLGGNLVAI